MSSGRSAIRVTSPLIEKGPSARRKCPVDGYHPEKQTTRRIHWSASPSARRKCPVDGYHPEKQTTRRALSDSQKQRAARVLIFTAA
jgi:hypothetical protein